MTVGLLLILQIILYHMTAAAVYNYNETSEVIIYEPDPTFLSGFRNIIDKDFIIGGLFPVFDCTGSGQEDLEMLEAMLFAIDRINNDMNLLPNLTIGYDVRDSCNNEIIGLNEALDFELDYDRPNDISFLGIVGPAYTAVTHSIATLLSLGIIEIPLISYASTDAALSNKDLYGYLLRTIPSDTLQTNAMADLVSYFEWEYVSVIFDDNDFGDSASNAFIDAVMERGICVDANIGIPLLEEPGANETIKEAVQSLIKSTASVVVAFTDNDTISALFEELCSINNTRKFVWIASDKWASSQLVRDKFPEIARGMYGFQLHIDHIGEFNDYFSQLTPSTNIRNPFFNDSQYNGIYYYLYCNIKGSESGSGAEYDCPDDLTVEPGYSQEHNVPHVIDAVYAFAHALQNFLDFSCDSPIRWNRTAQQCDGMKYPLTGANLLYFLYRVAFIGIRNHTVSFDKNGDPSGAYEISNLQKNESGEYEYVSVGFWNSAYKGKALMLNNNDKIEKVTSRCSDPCSEGMMVSITNQNCPLCFECIPCVGPTYSMNSTATNCSLCDDNHWGNNPLSGSTRCVPVKVQHLDFRSGWSIVSMCIATIALIILAAIIVIFIINWNTPVVKSSGREQMVMLLAGIGICCVLTYVVVAPPSTTVCVFQRIDVWFWFSLAFGALLVKIIHVARIFYSIKYSAKRPPLTDPIYQVIFTIAIVSFQLLLVLIGLIVVHPVIKRDPDVVITSLNQTGNAPEIIETCQQPHTAILVLSLIYNSCLIIGCTILGLMTMGFPENFNEAKHVMFTSFTLVVVWVLFIPVYLYTEDEFRPGVLALGIILSAVALMAGIFFPRVFIIIFQKHKNTQEFLSKQATGTTQSTNFRVTFQQSKHLSIV